MAPASSSRRKRPTAKKRVYRKLPDLMASAVCASVFWISLPSARE